MALIAQAATLAGRIPVIHFFDGFRTSHEVAKIVAVEPDTVRAMIDDSAVGRPPRHAPCRRSTRCSRGTAQNPDVFFQCGSAATPITTPSRPSCSRPWTASARSPAATTGSSTTSARRMPSASSW